MFVYRCLTLLLAAVLCASDSNGQARIVRTPENADNRESVSLGLQVTPTSGGVPLSQRDIIVTFRNNTKSAVILDGRHAFLAVMGRLFDRDGKEVGRIPISPPRPAEDGDLIVVEAGADYEQSCELGELYDEEILDELDAGPYALQFCYRKTVHEKVGAMVFSLLSVCSEPVTLT